MLSDVIDNISFTYISTSAIHGHGLFCEGDIQAGTTIGELDGQVISWSLHENLNLASEWNALPDNKLLVRPYKTKYFYINHSRTPNVEIMRPDAGGVQIVALRDIGPGEELTLDYRKEPLPDTYLNGHGATYL